MGTLQIGINLILNGFIRVLPLLFLATAILFWLCQKIEDFFVLLFELTLFVVITSLTLYGVFDGEMHSIDFRNWNLIPIYTNWEIWKGAFSGQIDCMIQIFGNIVIFIPFGIIFNHVHVDKKTLLAVPVAFPMLIEGLQFCGGRVGDVDDVLCNCGGMLIGYYIYALICCYKSENNENAQIISVKYPVLFYRFCWPIFFIIILIRTVY